MVNHYSRTGANIRIVLDGREVINRTLDEFTQLHIQAKEFTILQAGQTVEYIENGESKVLTVPANKVWLVEWELIKKER